MSKAVIDKEIISQFEIEKKIFWIHRQKVMLDKDLAELYGVTTGNFNKAVKRNIEIFPEDFMFQLNKKEYDLLRFQFGSLKRWQHSKYLPYVFTEQGVAMLSSVLKSRRAVQVNIAIMRVFIRLRVILSTYKELALRLEELEKRMGQKDEKIQGIFAAIRQLMESKERVRRVVKGFSRD